MSTDEAWLSETHHAVSDAALDTLFREAHTTRKWLDKKISPALLMAIYDLMRWGPTATNITPARIVFVMSEAAKARLKPHLDSGNVRQSMEAPVTAILGYDLDFARYLPRLYRDNPKAQSWFNDAEANKVLALRNGSLQGGYFILAARALGLDAGPMSGFDNAKVDAEFFPDGQWKSNFLCILGKGKPGSVPPRNPRFAFDEVCRIL